jgi:hypothetical protein
MPRIPRSPPLADARRRHFLTLASTLFSYKTFRTQELWIITKLIGDKNFKSMDNPICISTGAVYKLTEDMNEKIGLVKEFSPDGIELCFADARYLIDFQISKENLSYLCGLKSVSIHAPWLGIRYSENPRCQDVLKAIKDLYYLINARNVVFHADFVGDFDVFRNCDFIYSIENNDWRHPFNTVSEIGVLLSENERIKFTFDFAHALSVLPASVPNFINHFKDKIIQVHLSYHGRELSGHWFLHKYDSEEMRNLIKQLKILDVSIVLECVANDENELSLIQNEIEYVREVLN